MYISVRVCKMITIILFVLVVFFTVIYITIRVKNKESFKPPQIYFLSEKECRDFLQQDYDGFGKSLNQVNLTACDAQNTNHLLAKWGNCATQFTAEEIELLKKAAFIADEMIHKTVPDPLKNQLLSIPYQVAKTISPYYLDGMPHTRQDIIFLSDGTFGSRDKHNQRTEVDLARILLHEKAHLWERKYPEDMANWIEENQFIKVKKIADEPMSRRNPDVDEWIYKDKKGRILEVKYRTNTPNNLNDSYSTTNNIKHEHPHEIFAYTLEKILK